MSTKELFVNTQGVCFLCIKQLSKFGDVGTEISFRSISRFLKINPRSILLQCLMETMPLNENEEDSQLPCDFSVKLCPNCTSITTKLSSLIQELEVAQMLVNHQLKSFNNILYSSTDGEDQGKHWRNHVQVQNKRVKTDGYSSMDHVEIRLVEVLREQTRTNCSQIVRKTCQSTSPKVCLSKLKLERAMPATVNLVPSSVNPDHYDEDDDHSTEDIPYKSATPSPTLEETSLTPAFQQIHLPPPPPRRSNYVHNCQFCLQVFLKPGKLQEHETMHHLEQIFLENKLPDLTIEQFKICCHNLLEAEIDSFRKSALVKDVTITHCSYCCASFRDVKILQTHLCTRHFSEMEAKLNDIQLELFPNLQKSDSDVKIEYILG